MFGRKTARRLDGIMRQLLIINGSIEDVDEELEAMRAAVAQNTTVTQGVVTLITGLADQLEAAADDPDEVRSITAQLRENTTALSAALVMGTAAQRTEDPTGGIGGGDDTTVASEGSVGAGVEVTGEEGADALEAEPAESEEDEEDDTAG